MKTYVVGGAVRDRLLGLPVRDRDHVVVGATAEQMVAAGFTPVGQDFPVFLHPETKEEYALARTERKTAPGYKGFVFHAAPEVSLEQDLARRDLTINAMAEAEDGTLIDPCGGLRDLEARILRHVGPAFVEDPVRILRVARFAARFDDFSIAPETLALMRAMAASGELDALVPERIWQELARGLMEHRPARMLRVLAECGALAHIIPEAGASGPTRDWPALDAAAQADAPLTVRFAVWVLEAEIAADRLATLCGRLRVPSDCRDLALIAQREQRVMQAAASLTAEELLALFERSDAWRRPERFMLAFQACALFAACLHGQAPDAARLERALVAARGIDAGAIARAHAQAMREVPAAIRAARLEALREALHDAPRDAPRDASRATLR